MTFSLNARDATEAFDLARPIFAEGMNASQLEPTQVVNVEVSLVSIEHGEELKAPEAVPA